MRHHRHPRRRASTDRQRPRRSTRAVTMLALAAIGVSGCASDPAPPPAERSTTGPTEPSSPATSDPPSSATSSSTSGAPSSSATPRSPAHVTDIDQTGRVVVGTMGDLSPASVQAFADALAKGSLREIATKCPELTAQQITAFGANRGAILPLLTQPPKGGESGLAWRDGTTRVIVAWPDVEAAFACPRLIAS